MTSDEDAIYFNDEGRTRVLRGRIVEENERYVRVQRRDGTHDIYHRDIQRIKRGNSPEEIPWSE